MSIHLKRAGERATISWKHVWKTYCLSCNGNKMQHNNDLISDFLDDDSKIVFIKKLREKNVQIQ